jgi:hypothetical protein
LPDGAGERVDIIGRNDQTVETIDYNVSGFPGRDLG